MRTTQVVTAIAGHEPDAMQLLWTKLMPRVRGLARRMVPKGARLTHPTSIADDTVLDLSRRLLDHSLEKATLPTVAKLESGDATEGEVREFIRRAPDVVQLALRNRARQRARGLRAQKRGGEWHHVGQVEPHMSAARDERAVWLELHDELEAIANYDDRDFDIGDARLAVLLYRYNEFGKFSAKELARLFADRKKRAWKRSTFEKYVKADIQRVRIALSERSND